MKFQAILKNGRNGSKLFKSPKDALKMYPNGQILKLVTIEDINFDKIKTGNRNKRGRQFAMRAGI